jgi:general secretion pathway protein N
MISRNLYPTFAAVTLLLGAAGGFAAAPNATTVPLEANPAAGAIDIELATGKPASAKPNDPAPSGNQLWAIPLRDLSATRERPIFSPSRRPPPPAVAAAPYVLAQAVAKPVEPDRPRLALVGTIAGERQGFGIFLDQITNKIVRFKIGEGQAGWILRRINGREAMLQKNDETTVLALPAARDQGPATSAPQGEELKRLRR